MAKISRFISLTALIAFSTILTGCGNRGVYMDGNVVEETYVHKYGVAVPSGYWTSSGEDGAVISTMIDGVVVSRSYSAGVLDGETTYTYPHSTQIQKTEYYQNGTLIKETEFFFDGTPKCQTSFGLDETGSKLVSVWYLSGTPKSVENYQADGLVSGQYYTPMNQIDAYVEKSQGKRLIRDDYGQIMASDKIENGQLIERHTYHPNGSPKEVTPYKNELVDGVKCTYQPAGEPYTIEEWIKGQQEGTTLVYQHGEKYAEIPYVNGERHGIEVRYRDGNIKVQEVSWSMGEMHGPTITYIGDSLKTDWYYKGKPTTKTDYEFRTNKPVVR